MKIKNIIFDIGNVILEFNYLEVIDHFVDNDIDKQFIVNNIINSPEWLGDAIIDTGYITQKEAIEIVKDRTNHTNDKLIELFWSNYNDYAKVNEDVINMIKKLKIKGYNIYLLSNINQYMVDFINRTSNLFDIIDGYILSYQVHQIKPYQTIYKSLISKYGLKPCECLFIDDNKKNIDTGNIIGFKSIKVKPDDANDLYNIIRNLELL